MATLCGTRAGGHTVGHVYPFPLSLRVLAVIHLTLPSSQLFLVWVLGTSRDVLPVTTRPLRDSSTTEELAITSSNVLLMFVNRFDRQFN